ncbi:MAG: redoxin domain-containing protein [Desulfobulbaceae bacterium]|nr:redoxin domain-containing protein [Desulfobulbaceae bacterium]
MHGSLRRFLKLLLIIIAVLSAISACSRGENKLAVGDAAPDILVEDLDGHAVRLSELRNRPVVLRFFVTDCKFCRADTGVFNDYYRKHHSQGLEVVYLTTTVDRDKVRAFATELQIPFSVAIDYDRKVSQAYNIKVEPQTVIIGPDHRIKGAILGGVGEKELDEILAPLWGGATPGNSPRTATAPGQEDPRDHLKDDARCPVCGMFVAKYEVWVTRIEEAPGVFLDFDGVKDLLAYFYKPGVYGGKELKTDSHIWVKDYYSLKWLDGRTAFYVYGSDVNGPMGSELIPFATTAAAQSFLTDHHGKKVLTFTEITPALVEELRGGAHMKHGE